MFLFHMITMVDPQLKFCCAFILLSCIIDIESMGVNKYEVIIDYIDIPESRLDLLIDYGTVRVKKLDRTTYGIDGYFAILRDITDDMEASYEIYTLQGNEYRRTADKKIVKNLCSKSIENRAYFAKYFKFTDIPPNYECPFPKGRYNIINASFANEVLPFQPPKGEKYRVNVTVSLGELELTRYSIYAILNKLPFSWT